MNSFKKNLWTALTIIWSILVIAQIVLALFFSKNYLPFVKYIGWGFIFLSAIFGIVPIFTFRKKGKVEKGKSYMFTTRLVTSGIYSIVRHPQYVAGILISIGVIFLSQYWPIIIICILTIIFNYFDALRADQLLTVKFGKEYSDYIKIVPGLNFIAGIVRLLKKHKLKKKTI